MRFTNVSPDIIMTISRDSDDDATSGRRSTTPIRNSMSEDNTDAPVTPPSANNNKNRHNSSLLSSSYHERGSGICNPPQVPRHGRPINRRLLLTEAQERLSLPDLFAPRATTNNIPKPTASRRMRNARMLMMSQQRQQSSMQSIGESQLAIHPRAVQWGDYWDNTSHRYSQRHVYGSNPEDL